MAVFSVSPEEVQKLRQSGLAIIPIEPTEEMIEAGASFCLEAYNGKWEHARIDFLECYSTLINLGAL